MKSILLLIILAVVMLAFVQTRQHIPNVHQNNISSPCGGLGDWELMTTNIESICLVHRKR